MAQSDLAEWAETLRARILPVMRSVDGFRDITLLAQRGEDPAHVVVLTKWRDMKAVAAFAGDQAAKAVVPDFMTRFFKTYDAEATFYDEILREEGDE